MHWEAAAREDGRTSVKKAFAFKSLSLKLVVPVWIRAISSGFPEPVKRSFYNLEAHGILMAFDGMSRA